MASSALIGNLAVNLRMETAAFEQGAKRARGQMTGLQKGMASIGTNLKGLGVGLLAGLGVTALTDAIGNALDYAGSLGEVAQQLGVTTSELQRYRYIATQVGIEQEQMDRGLSFLSKTLGQLAMGAKAPAEALKQLGFSQAEIDRIAKMTAGEAIPMLADAFAKLDNETKASALSAQLFGGKLGPKFLSLLKGGASQIQELSSAYKALGIEMSEEDIKRADEAMDNWAKWKSVLAAQFARVAVDALELAQKIGATFDSWQAAVGRYYQRVGAQFRSFVSTMETIGSAVLDWPQRLYTAVQTWLGDRLNQAWDWVKAKLQQVADKFKWLYDVVVAHSYIPDMVDQIGAHMRRLDAEMAEPARAAAEKTAEHFQKLRNLLAVLYPEAEAQNEYLDQLSTLRRNFDESKMSADQYRDALDRLNKMRGSIPGIPTKESAIGDDKDLIDPAFEEEMAAWNKAQDGMADQSEASTARVVESFGRMANQVVGSLRYMVSSFKGGDILGGLLQLLDVVSQLAGQIGLFTGGGGGGLQKAQGGIGGGLPKDFGGFLARGGPAISGRSYIVGEDGPEWFTPRASGRVTPMGAGSGRGQTIIHMSGVITNDQFWQEIAARDGVSVIGGSNHAQSNMLRRRERAIP